jgi:hypothetical protein
VTVLFFLGLFSVLLGIYIEFLKSFLWQVLVRFWCNLIRMTFGFHYEVAFRQSRMVNDITDVEHISQTKYGTLQLPMFCVLASSL